MSKIAQRAPVSSMIAAHWEAEGEEGVIPLPISFAEFPDGSFRFETIPAQWPVEGTDVTVCLTSTLPEAIVALAQFVTWVNERWPLALHIMAMPDQRCDRQEEFGRDGVIIEGVAALIASVNLIANMGPWEYVHIMDPHSDATIEAFEYEDVYASEDMPVWHLKNFLALEHVRPTHLVQVDKGAEGRVAFYASVIERAYGYRPQIVQLDKTREDGRITGIEVVNKFPLFERNSFLFVDDICDGGRSFIEARRALGRPPEECYLFTNLGIYSNGMAVLESEFAAVGCATRMQRAHKYALGQTLTKTRGSKWTGKVVGFYSTALTPIGYAIESDTETGSVQIYPETALTLVK